MINTERLILTPMSLNDADFVYELVNSEDWILYIGQRNIATIEDAKKYIQEKMIDHYEQHGYGNYLVSLKDSGDKVGCVSLYNRDTMDDVDIGFAMLSKYYNMGYATEAALKLMDFAKEELKLEGVTAFTTKTNIASQKVIEKLGLKFKKHIRFEGDDEELKFYSIKF